MSKRDDSNDNLVHNGVRYNHQLLKQRSRKVEIISFFLHACVIYRIIANYTLYIVNASLNICMCHLYVNIFN